MTVPPCPCGSGKNLRACCGLYLSGKAYPNTAVSLLRSRYTAYATGNLTYLHKTWHPDSRPNLHPEDLTTQWTHLRIIRVKPGLKRSAAEFKALYLDGNQVCEVHEISLFKLYRKRWVYLQACADWP
ncbi:YchJ family protein [Microbulbifer spongiae]|uniref:YchJ family metal-binding protein n=1 Tax=Microbulbifer spongiae TaxID=2944933 RepID=A0ABY9EI83_9GAMM|nr:YchJ family metal-binding protein [Microbulbifer sp. MI-G]WKD51350.1 YchJ family metal-binding protein [Microbulbifer sp. MI-G]